MAQCSQSPSFSLIIFGRSVFRSLGPSPSNFQFIVRCDIILPVLLLSSPKPGPRERPWQECTILGVRRTHSYGSQLALVCQSRAPLFGDYSALGICYDWCQFGGWHGGCWSLRAQLRKPWVRVCERTHCLSTQWLLWKWNCGLQATLRASITFRVAIRQPGSQRSHVRTGWPNGCHRVWVTKAACIRSLLDLSTRAMLLLLLILSLNNAIIYSSHMF